MRDRQKLSVAAARKVSVAAFVAMLLPATAGAQPGVSVESGIGNDQATTVTPLARPVDRGNSTDTLLVLHQPHSYGHATNTAERAGQPQTLASLRLPATATAPAVRTTPPPAPAAVDRDVESIIREVWPDELEDRALRIAMRESRLQPGAINANHDATGLFQIMWSVHRRWLCPELGVCAQAQLLVADTNTRAAYALYQRDGWSPWSVN